MVANYNVILTFRRIINCCYGNLISSYHPVDVDKCYQVCVLYFVALYAATKSRTTN